jgi:excisionase family DNA binding protein
MSENNKDKFYSVKYISENFGLHYQTIVRMIQRKELGGVRLAGRWKIPQSEIDRLKELCDVRGK